MRENLLNRRKFLALSASTGLALSSRFAFAAPFQSERKLRVGIVGGRFGLGFFFNEHPNCTVEAVSDLLPDRRAALMKTYQCTKSYESLEKLLKDPKIEAVALFTPAPDHARHVIQSLKAGKHVLCAVPAALTIEECHEVHKTVKSTGLTYMMAETSVFRGDTITAKKLYKEGKFGTIFSSSAQYYHPGLEVLYFEKDGKPTWRHGLPPMLYPTHVTAFLIAVTGERLTHVTCQGWGDDSPMLKGNPYKNPFWNEAAFFRTNQGNSFIGEVCWKGALVGCERGEWRGDKMSYYSQYKHNETHIVEATEKKGTDDGGFSIAEPEMQIYKETVWWKTDLLPAPMRHDSGHGGSHTFITHEFIDSIISNREPIVNIREALAYTAPGIIAHESALKNGEYLKIPSFD
ncbi:Gfo/Idh/MocA family protein [Dyadobacter bucti]|uniref:Gfo/Idh/MocA family protein n=1 Tax=Dyadobacter bucti TaxID=2572203 RepID=UPI0011084B04|nr:Gfo/Idh/MocA family oxidoreductase [Dyadobacter bucti]